MALPGSSAIALFAASTALTGSLVRASHWESWTHSAAESGSRSMASRSETMASWMRPARAFIWATE